MLNRADKDFQLFWASLTEVVLLLLFLFLLLLYWAMSNEAPDWFQSLSANETERVETLFGGDDTPQLETLEPILSASPEITEAIGELLEEANALPPEQLDEFREALETIQPETLVEMSESVLSASPEMMEAIGELLEKAKELPPKQLDDLREAFETMQPETFTGILDGVPEPVLSASPELKEAVGELLEKAKELPPEQLDDLREAFETMQPETFIRIPDGVPEPFLRASPELKEAIAELLEEVEALPPERQDAFQGAFTTNPGSFINLVQGKGINPPPCWRKGRPDGERQYVFRIVVHETTIDVIEIWQDYEGPISYRGPDEKNHVAMAKDLAEGIPGFLALPQAGLQRELFLDNSKPIFDWSTRQTQYHEDGCRHWIQLVDGSGSKDSWISYRGAAELRFYLCLYAPDLLEERSICPPYLQDEAERLLGR